jgi:uncharacterized protein YjbI with pentapeptide repeats
MDYAQIAVVFIVYMFCLVGAFGKNAGGFFQFLSAVLLIVMIPATFIGLLGGNFIHVEAVISSILAGIIYFGFARQRLDDLWHKKSEAEIKLGDCDDSVKEVLLNSVMEDKSLPRKNLSKADLEFVTFTGCDFQGAIFDKTKFYLGEVSSCSFSKASFVSTFIDKTKFFVCDFTLANFERSEIGGEFTDCTFFKSQFYKAELGGSRIGSPFSFTATGSKFVDVDFSNAKLSGSTFSKCDFSRCVFLKVRSVIYAFGCIFENCNFEGALIFGNFENAVFQGVYMKGAELRANFSNCDFSDADVDGADFSGAMIYGSNLMNTNVTQKQIDSVNRYDANNEVYAEHVKGVTPPLLPKGVVWES